MSSRSRAQPEASTGGPITAAEVAAWVPESRFGCPPVKAWQDFADRLESYRVLRQGVPEPRSDNSLSEAVRLLRLLKPELESVIRERGDGVVAIRAQLLLLTACNLLGLVPKRAAHRSAQPWVFEAQEWAEIAQRTLAHDLWERTKTSPKISLDAEEGPVIAVVVRALARALGINASPRRVAAALERFARSLASPEVS